MSKEDKNFYKSGNKKFDEEDYQGAIDDYSKAIELNPDESSHYLDRADRRFYLEDYKGAMFDCSKALELTACEREKKRILELRSKAYQILSKIDLDNIQSL